MSASFRRNRTADFQIKKGPLDSGSRSVVTTVLERKGTKPWIGGITLTSTGLRDLDSIVGGGQPLGTAMLVEEDRWTQDLALALARYWSAEVSSLQDVCFDFLKVAHINSIGAESRPMFNDCYNTAQH